MLSKSVGKTVLFSSVRGSSWRREGFAVGIHEQQGVPVIQDFVNIYYIHDKPFCLSGFNGLFQNKKEEYLTIIATNIIKMEEFKNLINYFKFINILQQRITKNKKIWYNLS